MYRALDEQGKTFGAMLLQTQVGRDGFDAAAGRTGQKQGRQSWSCPVWISNLREDRWLPC